MNSERKTPSRGLKELIRVAPTATEVFLQDLPRPREVQKDLERGFFEGIRLANGVFKTTSSGRLDDLNEVVDSFLPFVDPLRVLDVAVSSGITSLEWRDQLQTRDCTVELVATDVCFRAFLVEVNQRFKVLLDAEGYPLQYECLGLGLRTSSSKRVLDSLLGLLRRLVRRRILPRKGLQLPKSSTDVPPPGHAASIEWLSVLGEQAATEIQLAVSELLELPDVKLVEESLLHPSSDLMGQRFHAVRAANILNSAYFNQTQLYDMVQTLKSRVAETGILAICSTSSEGRNHGAVFRRNQDLSFQLVAQLGDGHPASALVVA